MLTIKEAQICEEICQRWPGGMGCVLKKDETSKRGYISLDWGFQPGRMPLWKQFNNFDYSELEQYQDSHEIIFCPVTAVGRLRLAKNYQDHNKAYIEIRNALMQVTGLNEWEMRKRYNHLLSKDPETLAELFKQYQQQLKEQ